MGTHNSLDLYRSLVLRLHHDVAQCYTESSNLEISPCPCGCDEKLLKRSLSRQQFLDLLKIEKRLRCEGFEFFTHSLPAFGKAFDKALSSSEPLTIPGFKKIPGTQLPMLFGWLIQRVFTGCGFVRRDADIQALKHTRQLVYFVYKLELPYETTTNEKVIESFIQIQDELRSFEICARDPIIRKARTFVCRIFDGFNPRDIIPRHGPGAVSTGEEVGTKCEFRRLFKSTEEYYPFTGYNTLGGSHLVDRLQWLGSLEEHETGTAKVVLVPKDSRGPRLISMEPLELQWLQQGQLQAIVPWLEKCRLTRGHVNFTDQSINRRLALVGSLTSEWATLDMKDASDRVSLKLVEELFSGTELLAALKATRSSHTCLPDGRKVRLSSFAPMGSAVCFPIEAVCFYALSCAALVCEGLTWQEAMSSIFVYGDDIIVKQGYYTVLLRQLPKFGLKFNLGKCCVAGFFRESCGCDAFRGIDVTPIKLKTTWSHRRCRSAGELLSYVEASNRLFEQGYSNTAELIMEMVTSKYGQLPYVPDQRLSGGLPPPHIRWLSHSKSEGDDLSSSPSQGMIAWVRPHLDHKKLNRKFHCVQYHTGLQRIRLASYVIKPVYKYYKGLDDWLVLLRALTCGGEGLGQGRYALPRRTRLKRGWLVPGSYEPVHKLNDNYNSRNITWGRLGHLPMKDHTRIPNQYSRLEIPSPS
jgi:hypothetical protein